MSKKLKIGIGARDIFHHYLDKPVTLEDWFKEISQMKIFDYVDKTPPRANFVEYKKLSEKYNFPILSSGWFYMLGKEDNLILENLKMGSELGSKYHNVQIFVNHQDGHKLTDQEIAECYLKVSEYGEKVGCLPCFEIHINMWSEDFLRINSVAKIVEDHGVKFRMTLDHSHVIFKINNKEEQKMFNLYKQLKEKKIILDPFKEGNISEYWIKKGYVWLMHARSAIPNNPKNIGGKHPDGSVGRGVQYPFIRPLEGEYHSEWDELKLEPWKEVIRKVLEYHFTQESSLECITTEFIPNTDYGEGSTYSLLDNAVACAQWIRKEIKKKNLREES